MRYNYIMQQLKRQAQSCPINGEFSPFYSQLSIEDSITSPFSIVMKADKTDPHIIYIEASNEHLDSQQDIVVMKALENQVEFFLRKGIISYDHLHKIKDDPGYIIGEPLDVKFKKEEKVTWVKAKLYKAVDYAIKVKKLLQSNSTRLGASIGGFIKKRKALTKAISAILQVIWDELAITYKPINDKTLGNVSLIPIGAFAKALAVGSGVDAAQFTGGRALVPESLQGDSVNTLQPVLVELLLKINNGDIRTASDIYTFLDNYGMTMIYKDIASVLVKKFQNNNMEVNNGRTNQFRF